MRDINWLRKRLTIPKLPLLKHSNFHSLHPVSSIFQRRSTSWTSPPTDRRFELRPLSIDDFCFFLSGTASVLDSICMKFLDCKSFDNPDHNKVALNPHVWELYVMLAINLLLLNLKCLQMLSQLKLLLVSYPRSIYIAFGGVW